MNRNVSMQFSVFVILLFVAGCVHDLTQKASTVTDYQIEAVYRLNKHVFVGYVGKVEKGDFLYLKKLGDWGTESELSKFMATYAGYDYVKGVLKPGDTIQIIKVQQSRGTIIGRLNRVLAVIKSGSLAGTTVEVRGISKWDMADNAFVGVDPEFLSIQR